MNIRNPNAGHLVAIYGPMFSEKSGELIHRIQLAKTYQNKTVFVYKPLKDTRSQTVVSRVGTSVEAEQVKAFTDKEFKTACNYDVIGIDEAQLFDESILTFVRKLLAEKKEVIIAGLATNFQGKPFGHMPELIIEADEVVQKFACCSICGQAAQFSQRVINGKEVTSGAEVVIGDVESYQPRCREHFVR